MKRSLAEVAAMLKAEVSHTDELIQVVGVSTDTRTLTPGNLFIPLTGERFNGHEYVQESISKGAAAALWEIGEANPPQDFPLIYVEDTLRALQDLASAYRQQLNVRVLAVTGSNGKTSTKDWLASMLSQSYNVHKTEGNLNNHIGLPLTLLDLQEDTHMAVVEMGMSGRGEIARLSEIAQPEVAIITMIGEAHLLQLGSREEIAKAKLEVLKGFPADGLLVFPADEPLIHDLLADPDTFYKEVGARKPEELRTFRFGRTEDCDGYPTGLMMDKLTVHTRFNFLEGLTMTLQYPGWHNVMNALAAAAVAKYMGVNGAQIAERASNTILTGMRFETIQSPNGYTIINDAYNASPSSVHVALEFLSELKGYAHKIIVLGDMLELGAEELKYHQNLGIKLSPEAIDYVFTFGELAKTIAEEARKTFPPDRVQSYTALDSLEAAIRQVLKAGDIMLVKGSRGMKLEELIQRLEAQI